MFRVLYVENVYVWVLVSACRAPGNLCWIVLFGVSIRGYFNKNTKKHKRAFCFWVSGFEEFRV